ncbi:Nitrogenase cofactor biosynthesis protein NifB like protein, partial [Aduncisulcus paluster]
MSEDTAKAVLSFAKDKIQDFKRLHITWTGGEPLMAMDTIGNMSTQFMDLCQSASADYYASIITNGVLLDEETSKALGQECGVRDFQITVDGMPETHNRRRIMKDKSESFETILRNIKGALPYGAITLRMNIDKENAKESIDLIRHFYDVEGYRDHPGFMLSIKNVKPTGQYDDKCYNCHDFVPLYEEL